MAEPARPLSPHQPQSQPLFQIRQTLTLEQIVELLDRLNNGFGGDAEKIYDQEIDGAMVGSVFVVINHDNIQRLDAEATPLQDNRVFPGDLSQLLESIVEYLYERSLPYAQLVNDLRSSQSDDPGEQALKNALLQLENTIGDERQVPTAKATQIATIRRLLLLARAAFQRSQPEAEPGAGAGQTGQVDEPAGRAASGEPSGDRAGAGAGAGADSQGGGDAEPTDQQPEEPIAQPQAPQTDVQTFSLDETAELVLELVLDGLYQRLGFAGREPEQRAIEFRYQAKAILAGELAVKPRHLTVERLFNELADQQFFNSQTTTVTITEEFQGWLTGFAARVADRAYSQALAEKPADGWLNDIAIRVTQLVSSVDDTNLQQQLEAKVNAAPAPIATLPELMERFGAQTAAELYQLPPDQLYQALSQDRTLRLFERQLEVLLRIYLENQGLTNVSLSTIPAPLRQSFDREIERYLQSLSTQELVRLADPGNVEFRRLALLRFNNALLRHQLSPLVMLQLDQYVVTRRTIQRQATVGDTEPVLLAYLQRHGLEDLGPGDIPHQLKSGFADEVRAELRALAEQHRTAELNQVLGDRLERNQTLTELIPQLHDFIDQRLRRDQRQLEQQLDQTLADPGGVAVLNANTTVDSMLLALSGTGDHPENFIDTLSTVDKLNQVFGLDLAGDTSVAELERARQLLKSYWSVRRRQLLHRLKVELDTRELPDSARSHLQGYLDQGQPVQGMFVGLYDQQRDVEPLSQADADSQEFQLYSQRLRQARALVAYYKSQAQQHLRDEEMLVAALATPYAIGTQLYPRQFFAQALLPAGQYPPPSVEQYLGDDPTVDPSQLINYRLLHSPTQEAAAGPSLAGKLGRRLAKKPAGLVKDAITNQLKKLTPSGAAELAAMQGLKAVPYLGQALAAVDAAARVLRALGANVSTKRLLAALTGAATFLILKTLAAFLSSLTGFLGGLIGGAIGFVIGGPVGGLVGFTAGAHLGKIAGQHLVPNLLGGSADALGSLSDRGPAAAQAADQLGGAGTGTGISASFSSPIFTTTVGAGAVATGFLVFAATAATFLQPLPTVTPEGEISPFVTIEKRSQPIPDDGSFDAEELPVTITYTVSIQPKPSYTLTITDITDIITTNYNRDLRPDASKDAVRRTGSDFGFNLEEGPLVISDQDGPLILTYAEEYDESYLHSNVTNRFSISFTADGPLGSEQTEAETAEVICFGECPQFQAGCWPASGLVTQGVGGGTSHQTATGVPIQAVDIAHSSSAHSSGLNIYATYAGQAHFYSQNTGPYNCQGSNAGCFGNNVVISTNDGFDLLFAHLSGFGPDKTAGSRAAVQPGDIIGVMGSTGNSSGVHLHYEIPLRFNRRLAEIVPDPAIVQGPATRAFVRSCYDFGGGPF